MLGIHPLRLAGRRLIDDRVMPPDIAPSLHCHGFTGAAQHEDRLDTRTALGKRLVGSGLQLDDVAASPTPVRSDHAASARVLDAILERKRRESAEHHRMNGTDARAGLHRYDRLRHERHVDHHAIAPTDAARLKGVGKAADLGVQLPIAQLAHVAGLAFENDGGAMAMLGQMHVETVPRYVQLAISKPAVIRRCRIIERLGEELPPGDLRTREIGPVTHRVSIGSALQSGEISRLDTGRLGELPRRRKQSLLV